MNYQLVKIDGTNRTFVCHKPADVIKTQSTIHIIYFFILNLVINTIIDANVIYHIVITRGAVRRLNRFTVIDRQFAITAIAINLSSLIFRIPLIVGNFLSAHFSPEKKEMIFTICLTITLLDKTDMFLINVFVNSLFRREFLSIIRFNKTNSTSNVNNSNRRTCSPTDTVGLLQRQ